MDDLYTGAHSGSFGNVLDQEAVKRAKEQKIEKKAQLAPAYEVVADHIDKEIKRVANVDTFFVDEAVTPEELHREISSRKAYVAYLRELKGAMHNILRDRK